MATTPTYKNERSCIPAVQAASFQCVRVATRGECWPDLSIAHWCGLCVCLCLYSPILVVFPMHWGCSFSPWAERWRPSCEPWEMGARFFFSGIITVVVMENEHMAVWFAVSFILHNYKAVSVYVACFHWFSKYDAYILYVFQSPRQSLWNGKQELALQ
jgi:hypothetical protein